jgi:hypothetical protein
MAKLKAIPSAYPQEDGQSLIVHPQRLALFSPEKGTSCSTENILEECFFLLAANGVRLFGSNIPAIALPKSQFCQFPHLHKQEYRP